MAEKTLKTRIKLRYDTLANWNSTNPKLLAGEIAIVAIPNDNNPNTNPEYKPQGPNTPESTPPNILFKVGDGETLFTALPWASGAAADVYEWAKLQKFPVLTTGTGNVIQNVEWIVDKDHSEGYLKITKGQITIPGGSGGESTQANDTKVISAAELTNHTLSTATKTIQGDTNSGVSVTGKDSVITITGPVHTVKGGVANTSYSQTISQDLNTKALTIQQGVLKATKEADGNFISLDDVVTIGQGQINPGKTVLLLYGDEPRPIYAPTDLTDDFKDIALVEDIPTFDSTISDITDPSSDTVAVLSKVELGTDNKIKRTTVHMPTKKYVDNIVQGSVQYLGGVTVSSVAATTSQNLTELLIKKQSSFSNGDFIRVLNDGVMQQWSSDGTEKIDCKIHKGDVLYIANLGGDVSNIQFLLDNPCLCADTDSIVADRTGFQLSHGEDVGIVELKEDEKKTIIVKNGKTSIPILSHGDTSKLNGIQQAGDNKYFSSITVDEFGHVTATNSANFNNGKFTVTGSNGLTGSGSMTANQVGNTTANLSIDWNVVPKKTETIKSITAGNGLSSSTTDRVTTINVNPGDGINTTEDKVNVEHWGKLIKAEYGTQGNGVPLVFAYNHPENVYKFDSIFNPSNEISKLEYYHPTEKQYKTIIMGSTCALPMVSKLTYRITYKDNFVETITLITPVSKPNSQTTYYVRNSLMTNNNEYIILDGGAAFDWAN